MGAEVIIERRGKYLVLRAAKDPVEKKAKLHRMIDKRAAIGPIGEVEKRVPIEFPDRSRL